MSMTPAILRILFNIFSVQSADIFSHDLVEVRNFFKVEYYRCFFFIFITSRIYTIKVTCHLAEIPCHLVRLDFSTKKLVFPVQKDSPLVKVLVYY